MNVYYAFNLNIVIHVYSFLENHVNLLHKLTFTIEKRKNSWDVRII